MGRILERGLMGSIFKAFDYNKDGTIPFLEGSSKELAESLDLATTFLRFTSLDHKPEEEDSPLAYPVFVKPESMYRSMGLVGDRWMPDGNHDGVLNSDEFFSIVKIYREIQDLGRRYPNVTIYQEDPHLPYWESPGGPIFSRKQYIQNIAAVLSFPLPHLYRDLLSLKDPIRDSLLHALTPVPSEPIQVYQYAGSPPIVLKQYLRTEAGLAPAAIVTLLDRLMVVCDTDEDNSLSWRELDCALPLLLDGSIETLTSELVELDPGIHDGVRFILIFLGMKGLPHAMAKLIAINGGWRNFYLDPADLQAIISKLSISWRSLAYFIGAPPDATPSQQSFWVAEAMSRYGHCDTNTDGKIQDTEVNCVTNRVLEQIQELLSDLGHSFAGESVTHEISQWLKNSPLVQMGILFSINDQQQLGDALESEQVLRSSPEKILRVIEESIRRRRPLCLQPDC